MHRRRRADRRLRASGSPTASSTATSSSRSTASRTTFLDAASSRATGRSPTTRRSRRRSASCPRRTGPSCSTWRTSTSGRAFEPTPSYYLSTTGQVYWSDTPPAQRPTSTATTLALDRRLRRTTPRHRDDHRDLRPARASSPASSRRSARTSGATGCDLIYGTIRLIERDDESFLAWAQRALGLHHLQPARRAHARRACARRPPTSAALIDRAIATGRQLLPHLPPLGRRGGRSRPATRSSREFLRLKRAHDPDERFQSDWYRHYRAMFAEVL